MKDTSSRAVAIVQRTYDKRSPITRVDMVDREIVGHPHFPPRSDPSIVPRVPRFALPADVLHTGEVVPREHMVKVNPFSRFRSPRDPSPPAAR